MGTTSAWLAVMLLGWSGLVGAQPSQDCALATFRGRVTLDQHPLEGAYVKLLTTGGEKVVSTGKSDRDGQFQLSGKPGNAWLVVQIRRPFLGVIVRQISDPDVTEVRLSSRAIVRLSIQLAIPAKARHRFDWVRVMLDPHPHGIPNRVYDETQIIEDTGEFYSEPTSTIRTTLRLLPGEYRLGLWRDSEERPVPPLLRDEAPAELVGEEYILPGGKRIRGDHSPYLTITRDMKVIVRMVDTTR